ncbi:SET domain-containing protein [Candidatus Gracilibacteria bacterium]|nr:SET domain-containing protein [Candidatus Gracilibacteria bacterium]
MFHIKIKLDKSNIHNIGLFADQDISKGQIIYTINPTLNLSLTEKEFSELDENEKETIKHYGYFDKENMKRHLSFDDIRFCNHSIDSNITLIDNKIIAKKNISKGNELTQDYSEFEDLRKELIKKNPR